MSSRPRRVAEADANTEAVAQAYSEAIPEAADADGSHSSAFTDEEDEFSWISYFLTLKGNEFFCQVDEDYINDGFNLMGLSAQIPYFDFALDVILDADYDDDHISQEQQEMIESEAENLYGLIHARYIRTNRGLHAMLDKYRSFQFGRCPRVFCNNQPFLPCGIYDTSDKAPVKLYCPKCNDIYSPKLSRSENVDGAYFGTTFPHLFFLAFPELQPEPSKGHYVPRVFGFELHESWHEKSLQSRKEREKITARTK